MSRSRIGQSGRYADIESMKSCPEANVVTVAPHAVSSLWRALRMDPSSSTMATLGYPLSAASMTSDARWPPAIRRAARLDPHQPCAARPRCRGLSSLHGRDLLLLIE